MLAFKTGELNLKDYKKWEMRRKFGDTDCFMGCDAKDDLDHVMQCNGYETKPKNYYLDGTDKKMAEYLRALDAERWRKFEMGLVYRRNRVNSATTK